MPVLVDVFRSPLGWIGPAVSVSAAADFAAVVPDVEAQLTRHVSATAVAASPKIFFMIKLLRFMKKFLKLVTSLGFRQGYRMILSESSGQL